MTIDNRQQIKAKDIKMIFDKYKDKDKLDLLSEIFAINDPSVSLIIAEKIAEISNIVFDEPKLLSLDKIIQMIGWRMFLVGIEVGKATHKQNLN